MLITIFVKPSFCDIIYANLVQNKAKFSHKHNYEHNRSNKCTVALHNIMYNKLEPNYVLNFYINRGIIAVVMGIALLKSIMGRKLSIIGQCLMVAEIPHHLELNENVYYSSLYEPCKKYKAKHTCTHHYISS